MKTSFEIKETFSASPSEIYEAWLSSEGHSAMTGGGAECEAKVDGKFTAWDGYISGVNVSLVPNLEIVQTWRTMEFKEVDEDSNLSIRFKSVPAGCEVTLNHSEIPEGQPDYEKGWVEHYFNPMKEYFGA